MQNKNGEISDADNYRPINNYLQTWALNPFLLATALTNEISSLLFCI